MCCRKRMKGETVPLYDPLVTGNLYGYLALEDLSEVEAVDGKGNGQGHGAGTLEQRRGEESPIQKSLLALYPQAPQGLQKCLEVGKAEMER